jgi:hypothetical protein
MPPDLSREKPVAVAESVGSRFQVVALLGPGWLRSGASAAGREVPRSAARVSADALPRLPAPRELSRTARFSPRPAEWAASPGIAKWRTTGRG